MWLHYVWLGVGFLSTQKQEVPRQPWGIGLAEDKGNQLCALALPLQVAGRFEKLLKVGPVSLTQTPGGGGWPETVQPHLAGKSLIPDLGRPCGWFLATSMEC